jgi:peptide/nickel transport system permease protein
MRWIFSRLLQSCIVVMGVSVLTFLLVHLVPGNPGRIALGPFASNEAVERLDIQVGLKGSVVSQYLHYLGNLLHGDLGTSIANRISVTSEIAGRIVPSLLLISYAIVISLLIAVPLALIAALRADRGADYLVRVFSVFTYALPPFWFGLLLSLLLGLRWHVFATSGFDDSSITGIFRTLTLPALTLSLYVAPLLVRTLRASLVAAFNAEQVQAANARGLSAGRVIVRYVLRNSLLSSVTLLGVMIGILLSITVVVEQIFAIPGLGSLLVSAVDARDYPVVQGLTLIFALAVILANLSADLMYAILDPRVRL